MLLGCIGGHGAGRILRIVSIAACLASCVAEVPVDEGRPCPCGEGLRCVEGECRDLPAPECGDGFVEPEAGEICEPGVTSEFLTNAICVDCDVVCEEGWADCDDTPGCESDLTALTSCGSCETPCLSDEKICDGGFCFVAVVEEATPIAAVAMKNDYVYWATQGTTGVGGHQGDSEKRHWHTGFADTVNVITAAVGLDQPHGGMAVPELNPVERYVVWGNRRGSQEELLAQRHSILAPQVFQGPTTDLLVARMNSFTNRDFYWSARNVQGNRSIFKSFISEPFEPNEELLTTFSGTVEFLSFEHQVFWSDGAAVLRLGTVANSVPETVLQVEATALRPWGDRLFVATATDLRNHNVDNGTHEVVAEQEGIFDLAVSEEGVFWLRQTTAGGELWVRSHDANGWTGGQQLRLKAGLQNPRYVEANGGSVVWTEIDDEGRGAMYAWRGKNL